MENLKKLIFLSLLVSLGLALSVIEMSIPLPIAVPGAKLGLSNMVILITLAIFGFKEAFIVSTLKSIVLMLVTGSISSFIYSISGAIFSSIAMYLAYKYLLGFFSLMGVSIIGALAHNFAQVTVASFIVKNIRIYTYLPFLMLLSLFTGYFVGLGSKYVIDHLEKTLKYVQEEV